MKKKGARRYLIKGKEKAWVLRDKLGRFKKWTQRKRAAKADRRKKVSPAVKSGTVSAEIQKGRRSKLKQVRRCMG